MASPPDPVAVPVVTYEYLLYLPSSERPQPLARRKARGLLSGSCTLATAGHWLWLKNLDMIGSLQRQTAQEPSTLYQIWSHHS
jgi:hypothetical protein